MSAFNTKAEGHRGEAVRLELMAKDLLSPAAKRTEIAAELRVRAEAHWAIAAEADGESEAFESMQDTVAAL